MPRLPANSPQAAALATRTVARGELARPMDREGWLRCVACGHRCPIGPGRAGVCRVRFNSRGRMHVPYGYTAYGLALDPVEKKPFFHVHPGASALSFGMLGCNFHCAYCQNWQTSQVLRDAQAAGPAVGANAAGIAAAARGGRARIVVSTYNEPLITAEWAADVFDACRPAGLVTGMVSNGHATPEVLEYLRPRMDLFKVDLKSFRDRAYRDLGGALAPVLDGIRAAVALGLWVEVVTLVVPGLNDDAGEWREMASFLASVSPDLPWHLTAFHPDYRMTGPGPTPARTLAHAAETGRAAGLRFVYAGNVRGLPELESTWCPGCGTRLVERNGYRVGAARVAGGACPRCARAVPGMWSDGAIVPVERPGPS